MCGMKFTIRDVLFTTVVVALVFGWWLDRARRAKPNVQTIQPATEERYELIEAGKDHDKLYLFNPRTGQTWERYSSGEWISFAKFPNRP